jgi:hypothetical protein
LSFIDIRAAIPFIATMLRRLASFRTFWQLLGLLALFSVSSTSVHAAPEKITVGAYVNDIQSVDLRTDSHVIDFYVWFRWSNADRNASKTIEFMNMVAPDNHVNQSLYDPPKVQPDGSRYAVFHHNGAFSSKFPLRNYPFDTQILTVELEDSQLGADELKFEVDKEGITINPSVRLSSYEIGVPALTILSRPYPTTFGDLSKPNISSYSRVILTIPVRRPWISGALKLLLPVGLILLSASLALLIRPDQIEARISLGITALLTLVALQFTASTDLPEVDYLMLIDKVYLASYAFILAVLIYVVRASWRGGGRSEQILARIDRRSGAILVIVYTAVLALLIVPALRV